MAERGFVMQCEMMLDLLTGYATGTLDSEEIVRLEAHLEACDNCRAELEIVRLLADSDPVAVPDGLEARVRAAAREALDASVANREAPVEGVVPLRPRSRVPSWLLSAAAVLVLALGTPLLMNQMGDGAGELEIGEMIDDPVATVWTTEDGLIAGAPALDMLTDEELSQLLEELEG